MNRSLALLAIGLLLGGLTGFMFAAAYGITLDGHDHANHDAQGHEMQASAAHAPTAKAANDPHQHHANHDEVIFLPAGPDAPTLAMELTNDPASGWNLHIRTAHFRFAPEHASQAHVPGEGHAHVYVNGKKIARQYGAWLHIANLAPGKNVVSVTLNANDHRQLGVGETPLRVEQVIDAK